LGPLWGYFGFTFGALWGHFGIISGGKFRATHAKYQILCSPISSSTAAMAANGGDGDGGGGGGGEAVVSDGGGGGGGEAMAAVAEAVAVAMAMAAAVDAMGVAEEAEEWFRWRGDAILDGMDTLKRYVYSGLDVSERRSGFDGVETRFWTAWTRSNVWTSRRGGGRGGGGGGEEGGGGGGGVYSSRTSKAMSASCASD
jgi:hypothetical protein